jgi:hypothetical protein
MAEARVNEKEALEEDSPLNSRERSCSGSGRLRFEGFLRYTSFMGCLFRILDVDIVALDLAVSLRGRVINVAVLCFGLRACAWVRFEAFDAISNKVMPTTRRARSQK